MNPNITPYWYENNLLNGIDVTTPIYKFMPLQYGFVHDSKPEIGNSKNKRMG